MHELGMGRCNGGTQKDTRLGKSPDTFVVHRNIVGSVPAFRADSVAIYKSGHHSNKNPALTGLADQANHLLVINNWRDYAKRISIV
jgi:hypothetical protein